MTRRPAIKPGDLVRLSKKGKQANYPWPDNVTVVVTEVRGDGIDRRSIIYGRTQINGTVYVVNAYRHHLWYTGKNIFKTQKKVRVLNSKR